MKLAFEGGTYEETRSLATDAAGEIRSSAYHAFGNLVCSGERKGGTWVVTTVEEGKPARREAPPPPTGATTGMGFVLASAVPRGEGGGFVRVELDEANGLRSLGETSFRWAGKAEREWEGERLLVHRIVVRKANGNELPLEVAGDGRIVAMDWGGGNVMVLSKTSTRDLFRPAPPAAAVVSEGAHLILRADLAAFTPQEVFDHFTKKELLAAFWPPEAEVEAKVGGKYHLDWPGPGWKLRGTVRVWEPGRRLAFTWKWEHTPEAPELLMTIDLAPAEGGGTTVTLTQGPYRDTPEDARERSGHVRGWQDVFGRLRSLR